MFIDIDRLTEAELRDLNHRIVARLRFLHEMKAHASMLEFKIGERVSFCPQDRGTVRGAIVRYNKKTVTIIADDGTRWNVSPHLLAREVDGADAQGRQISRLGGKPLES
jgi:hypothetical protein